jgi:hypothetical protein
MSQPDAHHDELHDRHGNSVAAWTAVTIVAIAGIVAAVGVSVATPWLFWVGVLLAALGVVVGKVMAMMGFGVAGAVAAAQARAGSAATD